MSWRDDAACVGHTAIYVSTTTVHTAIAVAICEGCPVRQACADHYYTMPTNRRPADMVIAGVNRGRVVCGWCGKQFPRSYGRAWCSKPCQRQLDKVRVRHCLECGAEFVRPKYSRRLRCEGACVDAALVRQSADREVLRQRRTKTANQAHSMGKQR